MAFSADVPAAIRTAIATVLDATAELDPARFIVLVHPDNAALLQDVSPVSGSGIGEPFQRFSGALVYPSASVTTGSRRSRTWLPGACILRLRAAG